MFSRRGIPSLLLAMILSCETIVADLARAASLPVVQARPLYVFQDVHGHVEAQKSIAKSIEDARRAAGLRSFRLGVEGAAGAFDFSTYHGVPDAALARKIVADFVEEKRVGGPEWAGFLDSRLALTGIEDPSLYVENVEAYRAAMDARPELMRDLERREREIGPEKERRYSGGRKEVDAVVTRYRKGAAPLSDYLRALRSAAPDAYFAVETFLAARDLEQSLDIKRVETDVRRLARRHAGPTPHLDAFLRYRRLAAAIDPEKLFAEARAMELAVYGDDPLAREDRRIYLAKKLSKFELTPAEWEELKPAVPETATAFARFYELADRRSRVMAARVVRDDLDGIVVGGFHTLELRRLLKTAGRPVRVVRPKISSIEPGDANGYLSVFAREKTPLEKLFSKWKLFLRPPPALGVTPLVSVADAGDLETDFRARYEAAGGVTVEPTVRNFLKGMASKSAGLYGHLFALSRLAPEEKWLLLQQIYVIAPPLALMMLITFEKGTHGPWRDIAVNNPEAFGELADRALAVFRDPGRPARHELDGAMFHPLYSIEGLCGMMGYFSVEEGQKALAKLSDENAAFFIEAMVLFRGKTGLSPASRQRIMEQIMALPSDRFKRVATRLSPSSMVEIDAARVAASRITDSGAGAWRWKKPSFDELAVADVVLSDIFEQAPATGDLGLSFVEYFSMKTVKDNDPGRVLRAVYAAYPDIAAALIMSVSAPWSWKEFIDPSGIPAIEPELVGVILNRGLALPEGKNEIFFGDVRANVLVRAMTTAGLLCEVSPDVANKIMEPLGADQRRALVKALRAFQDYGAPADLPSQARVDALVKSLSPAEPALPPNATRPVTGNPGSAIGYLKIIDDDYPSIETLRALDPTDIVAMRGLPMSEIFGPCAGLITTEEPTLTGHGQARARAWGAPHAVLPSLAEIREWNGKLVVLETSRNVVHLRLATEQEEEEFNQNFSVQFTIDIPIVKKVDELVLPVDHPNAVDPDVVGYKVALLRRLALAGANVDSPGVEVKIVGGVVIPMSAFSVLLGELGEAVEAQYNGWIRDLRPEAGYRDRTLEERLKNIRDVIDRFDYEMIWREFAAAGGERLLATGSFVRGLTNTDSLPEHPGVGAGMIATVPNVRDKAAFIDALKEVMSSAWLFEAYWERRTFHIDQAHVFPAVWVVPSEPADFSGVLHTSDISASNNEQFVIEMFQGQGQGESLAADLERFQGHPARLVVHKQTGGIIEEREGQMRNRLELHPQGGVEVLPSVGDRDFTQLPDADKRTLMEAFRRLSHRLETVFEQPQDVELVIKKNHGVWAITLLQTRSLSKPFLKDLSVERESLPGDAARKPERGMWLYETVAFTGLLAAGFALFNPWLAVAGLFSSAVLLPLAHKETRFFDRFLWSALFTASYILTATMFCAFGWHHWSFAVAALAAPAALHFLNHYALDRPGSVAYRLFFDVLKFPKVRMSLRVTIEGRTVELTADQERIRNELAVALSQAVNAWRLTPDMPIQDDPVARFFLVTIRPLAADPLPFDNPRNAAFISACVEAFSASDLSHAEIEQRLYRDALLLSLQSAMLPMEQWAERDKLLLTPYIHFMTRRWQPVLQEAIRERVRQRVEDALVKELLEDGLRSNDLTLLTRHLLYASYHLSKTRSKTALLSLKDSLVNMLCARAWTEAEVERFALTVVWMSLDPSIASNASSLWPSLYDPWAKRLEIAQKFSDAVRRGYNEGGFKAGQNHMAYLIKAWRQGAPDNVAGRNESIFKAAYVGLKDKLHSRNLFYEQTLPDYVRGMAFGISQAQLSRDELSYRFKKDLEFAIEFILDDLDSSKEVAKHISKIHDEYARLAADPQVATALKTQSYRGYIRERVTDELKNWRRGLTPRTLTRDVFSGAVLHPVLILIDSYFTIPRPDIMRAVAECFDDEFSLAALDALNWDLRVLASKATADPKDNLVAFQSAVVSLKYLAQAFRDMGMPRLAENVEGMMDIEALLPYSLAQWSAGGASENAAQALSLYFLAGLFGVSERSLDTNRATFVKSFIESGLSPEKYGERARVDLDALAKQWLASKKSNPTTFDARLPRIAADFYSSLAGSLAESNRPAAIEVLNGFEAAFGELFDQSEINLRAPLLAMARLAQDVADPVVMAKYGRRLRQYAPIFSGDIEWIDLPFVLTGESHRLAGDYAAALDGQLEIIGKIAWARAKKGAILPVEGAMFVSNILDLASVLAHNDYFESARRHVLFLREILRRWPRVEMALAEEQRWRMDLIEGVSAVEMNPAGDVVDTWMPRVNAAADGLLKMSDLPAVTRAEIITLLIAGNLAACHSGDMRHFERLMEIYRAIGRAPDYATRALARIGLASRRRGEGEKAGRARSRPSRSAEPDYRNINDVWETRDDISRLALDSDRSRALQSLDTMLAQFPNAGAASNYNVPETKRSLHLLKAALASGLDAPDAADRAAAALRDVFNAAYPDAREVEALTSAFEWNIASKPVMLDAFRRYLSFSEKTVAGITVESKTRAVELFAVLYPSESAATLEALRGDAKLKSFFAALQKEGEKSPQAGDGLAWPGDENLRRWKDKFLKDAKNKVDFYDLNVLPAAFAEMEFVKEAGELLAARKKLGAALFKDFKTGEHEQYVAQAHFWAGDYRGVIDRGIDFLLSNDAEKVELISVHLCNAVVSLPIKGWRDAPEILQFMKRVKEKVERAIRHNKLAYLPFKMAAGFLLSDQPEEFVSTAREVISLTENDGRRLRRTFRLMMRGVIMDRGIPLLDRVAQALDLINRARRAGVEDNIRDGMTASILGLAALDKTSATPPESLAELIDAIAGVILTYKTDDQFKSALDCEVAPHLLDLLYWSRVYFPGNNLALDALKKIPEPIAGRAADVVTMSLRVADGFVRPVEFLASAEKPPEIDGYEWAAWRMAVAGHAGLEAVSVDEMAKMLVAHDVWWPAAYSMNMTSEMLLMNSTLRFFFLKAAGRALENPDPLFWQDKQETLRRLKYVFSIVNETPPAAQPSEKTESPGALVVRGPVRPKETPAQNEKPDGPRPNLRAAVPATTTPRDVPAALRPVPPEQAVAPVTAAAVTKENERARAYYSRALEAFRTAEGFLRAAQEDRDKRKRSSKSALERMDQYWKHGLELMRKALKEDGAYEEACRYLLDTATRLVADGREDLRKGRFGPMHGRFAHAQDLAYVVHEFGSVGLQKVHAGAIRQEARPLEILKSLKTQTRMFQTVLDADLARAERNLADYARKNDIRTASPREIVLTFGAAWEFTQGYLFVPHVWLETRRKGENVVLKSWRDIARRRTGRKSDKEKSKQDNVLGMAPLVPGPSAYQLRFYIEGKKPVNLWCTYLGNVPNQGLMFEFDKRAIEKVRELHGKATKGEMRWVADEATQAHLSTLQPLLDRLNADISNRISHLSTGDKRIDAWTNLRNGLSKPRPQQVEFFNAKLDENQRSTISHLLDPDLEYGLVWGPPGTGKTTSIVELLQQFSRRKNGRGGDITVVVCQSNFALDNIGKRLQPAGVPFVRAASDNMNIDPLLKPKHERRLFDLMDMIEAHHGDGTGNGRGFVYLRTNNGRDRRADALLSMYLDGLPMSEIRGRFMQWTGEVVPAMLEEWSAMRDRRREDNKNLELLIDHQRDPISPNLVQDESTLATLAESAGPISQFQPKKIIMVGDDKQLPAYGIDETLIDRVLVEVENFGFLRPESAVSGKQTLDEALRSFVEIFSDEAVADVKVSLFERAIASSRTWGGVPFFQLLVGRRGIWVLTEIFNRLFYGGKLINRDRAEAGDNIFDWEPLRQDTIMVVDMDKKTVRPREHKFIPKTSYAVEGSLTGNGTPEGKKRQNKKEAGASWRNFEEAGEVVRLVAYFLNQGLKTHEIDLLSPYSGQNALIHELLWITGAFNDFARGIVNKEAIKVAEELIRDHMADQRRVDSTAVNRLFDQLRRGVIPDATVFVSQIYSALGLYSPLFIGPVQIGLDDVQALPGMDVPDPAANARKLGPKTFDAMQGRENEAVIISFTRSNEEGRTGFLNLNRINVALSRAKSKLALVGSFKTLIKGARQLDGTSIFERLLAVIRDVYTSYVFQGAGVSFDEWDVLSEAPTTLDVNSLNGLSPIDRIAPAAKPAAVSTSNGVDNRRFQAAA